MQQKYGDGDGGDWQCHFYPTPRFIDKYVGWCGQHTDFPEYLEGIKEITVNIGMKPGADDFFQECIDGKKDKPTSND